MARYGMSSTILSITLLLLFLSGCSIKSVFSQPDGPPRFDLSWRTPADAVPKKERKSRIGNRSHYHVRGKEYYVLPSAQGYTRIGRASWYGKKFHGRRTSNGEVYDMYKMTAANRELPLPTYLKVTNLSNKKHVIVRVNDRGPFHNKRILDLSYAAAKKLGMLKHGTDLVRIEAITPGEKRKAEGYRDIQVATFNGQEHALKLKERLTLSLQTPVHTQPYHGKFQVHLSSVPEKEIANVLRHLESLGIRDAVVR